MMLRYIVFFLSLVQFIAAAVLFVNAQGGHYGPDGYIREMAQLSAAFTLFGFASVTLGLFCIARILDPNTTPTDH